MKAQNPIECWIGTHQRGYCNHRGHNESVARDAWCSSQKRPFSLIVTMCEDHFRRDFLSLPKGVSGICGDVLGLVTPLWTDLSRGRHQLFRSILPLLVVPCCSVMSTLCVLPRRKPPAQSVIMVG
jgi:hypothetical protein